MLYLVVPFTIFSWRLWEDSGASGQDIFPWVQQRIGKTTKHFLLLCSLKAGDNLSRLSSTVQPGRIAPGVVLRIKWDRRIKYTANKHPIVSQCYYASIKVWWLRAQLIVRHALFWDLFSSIITQGLNKLTLAALNLVHKCWKLLLYK